MKSFVQLVEDMREVIKSNEADLNKFQKLKELLANFDADNEEDE